MTRSSRYINPISHFLLENPISHFLLEGYVCVDHGVFFNNPSCLVNGIEFLKDPVGI